MAFSGSDMLAMLPVLSREKIVSIAGTSNPAINNPAKYPYHFGLNPLASDMMEGLEDEMGKNGISTFTALVSNDALGEGAKESLRVAFEGLSITYAVMTYNAAELDFTLACQKALDAKAQALLVVLKLCQ